MGELGITDLIELGTGKVLGGLVKRINKNISGKSIQTMADMEAFVDELNL